MHLYESQKTKTTFFENGLVSTMTTFTIEKLSYGLREVFVRTEKTKELIDFFVDHHGAEQVGKEAADTLTFFSSNIGKITVQESVELGYETFHTSVSVRGEDNPYKTDQDLAEHVRSSLNIDVVFSTDTLAPHDWLYMAKGGIVTRISADPDSKS